MRLVIANVSTKVSAQQLDMALAAIGTQVIRDFKPEWSREATLTGVSTSVAPGSKSIQQARDAVIYLGDYVQDPTQGVANALGYHGRTSKDLPYGFIYLDICDQAGEAWTCTLSHEVLELLADPKIDSAVRGPGAGGETVSYDLEVCDPTQGDSYEINDIKVSNFVNRSYFGGNGGSPATNHMELELTAFGVRPNGYYKYEDAAGRTHEVDGPRVSQARRIARAMMTNGRRTVRRTVRHLVEI
jgi:hypothetical protein